MFFFVILLFRQEADSFCNCSVKALGQGCSLIFFIEQGLLFLNVSGIGCARL